MSGLAEIFLSLHPPLEAGDAPSRRPSTAPVAPGLPPADYLLVALPSESRDKTAWNAILAGLEELVRAGKSFRAFLSWKCCSTLDLGDIQRRLRIRIVSPHSDGPSDAELLEGLTGVVVPHFPLDEMARVAALLPDSLAASVLLAALARGLAVVSAIPSGLDSAEVGRLQGRLESLGIRFVPPEQVAAVLRDGPVGARFIAPSHVPPNVSTMNRAPAAPHVVSASNWIAAPPLAPRSAPCPIEGGRPCDECGRCSAFGF